MNKLITTVTVGLALLGIGGSAFAATATTNPNQADLATLKQLNQQEKDLNAQLKQQQQGIIAALLSKSGVSQDVRNQVKQVMADIKPLREQIKSLQVQLKQAKQNNDKATVDSLKQQIKQIRDQIQAKLAPIKDQLAAIKQSNQANKQLNTQLQPIRQQEKTVFTQLKDLAQQRKSVFTQLKADRTAKNTTAVKADLDKAITLEQSVIQLKQQLLQDQQEISSIVNN